VSLRGTPVRHPRPGYSRHWTLLALLAGCASGCDLPGQPKTGERYTPPQQERTFSVLFQQNCVGCHGADGKLGPAPPLNDKLFLALIPDTELLRVITEGRPGTLMPAFAAAKGGQLTAEQVTVLAEGTKQRWGPAAPAPNGAPSYLVDQTKPDGAGRKEDGVMAFARACACCHGDHGQGGNHGARTDGRSVGSINQADFLALISDQALRRLVITGRPELGMPDYASSEGRPAGFKPLSSQNVADLVALLASWRHGESANGERN
jgi:mono/diheme cytochrome c family protein